MVKPQKSKTLNLPPRSDVSPRDTWDLGSLFKDDEQWERAFRRFERQTARYADFRGQLGKTPQALRKCLDFDCNLDRLGERLGVYAFLKTTEDQANGTYQRMLGRFQSAATRASESASFIRPEIIAVPDRAMHELLKSKELAPYILLIERIRRYRKHTLSAKEERLLAQQGEMAQAASKIFRQLLDADMRFGTVKDEHGNVVELTNSTFSKFLVSPDRPVRRRAFHQFYAQFAGHENCLAAALAGSVQKDAYYAKARGYDSSLAAALFPDNVPTSVYHNLINTVRARLPVVHRYYELRRRKMRLKDIHHYDTYVPILAECSQRRSWDQAVNEVVHALAPLGKEYVSVLERGLKSRWCDRYPNRGKQSGAFSCGSYEAEPFILMNYKPDVLDDMFTLAHEAGHSMHSFYSARHQPFQYYNYTIFVAEVASTFNEQLLSEHLRAAAKNDQQRAYLINRDIDAIRGTIIRQTMFAEFEQHTHQLVEGGEPLTVEAVKRIYVQLLQDYFGPNFALDPELSLEGLRIPHFYRAFYVYKYATGLSAAIALSKRVLQGQQSELDAYLGFLKAGCSKFPLELLQDAGVDMTTPAPLESALDHFEALLHELERLI